VRARRPRLPPPEPRCTGPSGAPRGAPDRRAGVDVRGIGGRRLVLDFAGVMQAHRARPPDAHRSRTGHAREIKSAAPTYQRGPNQLLLRSLRPRGTASSASRSKRSTSSDAAAGASSAASARPRDPRPRPAGRPRRPALHPVGPRPRRTLQRHPAATADGSLALRARVATSAYTSKRRRDTSSDVSSRRATTRKTSRRVMIPTSLPSSTIGTDRTCRGELVADLGNVAVDRVEPGQPDPDELIGVRGVQPGVSPRTTVVLVDLDGHRPALRCQHRSSLVLCEPTPRGRDRLW
jgi:hypothetical protein